MAAESEDDAFEQLSNRFVEWLKQNGTTVSPKIAIEDLRWRWAGRGVIAKEAIEEDEELFSIPRSSILTIETSSIPAELKGDLDDPWLSLILAMIYEFQNGADSSWKPYFDILPEEFDTLMHWSAVERSSLEGSAILDKIGKASADQTFTEKIIPIIRQHEEAFNAGSLKEKQLLELCHRMGSTIMAYAFDLEDTAENSNAPEDGWEDDSDSGQALQKGMIPLADILNADADRNNARLFYHEGKVVMKAVKAIGEGEELFNDYGPLPRSDLLRRYGYMSDNYAKYDVVEIPLDLIKTTIKSQTGKKEGDVDERLQYLDDQNALEDGYDVFRAEADEGPFSEELRIVANTLAMCRSDFNKLKKESKLPKPELFKASLDLLCTLCLQRLGPYPMNNLKDTHLRDRSRTTQRRVQMAMHVIEGERHLLQEAMKYALHLPDEDGKRKADELEEKANKKNKKTVKRIRVD